MELMLTLKPRMEINQAVTVVPILAPMMTPIDSVNVSKEALAKLTTMSVVAEEDWIIAVIEKPVRTARKRIDVAFARIERILSPARSSNASLITFIP